jgi:ArsR family transcriptional regulator
MMETVMTANDVVLFAKAIADSTRQQIMKLCCCEWISVADLTEQMKVSQPTVSHHLAILREAGLVDLRSEGRQTFYTLNQNRIALCCGQLMVRFAPDEASTEAVKQTLS